MSKGSNRRPEDKKSFDENYDRIFNKSIKHPVTKEEVRYRILDDKSGDYCSYCGAEGHLPKDCPFNGTGDINDK